MSSLDDEQYLRRCIELARLAKGSTAPNPMVGCVIVDKSGQIIAEGYHRGPGSLHAEADALDKLGGKAPPGATLYCNLEPCNHKRNRRTEPCAPLLLRAGISRLVMGMGDPIRSHAGGARFLENSGVKVTRDVLRKECVALNQPFITWARHGRPMVTLKAAISLDGKVATRTRESQWITGTKARAHGHSLRSRMDAILVGVGTVRSDDPRLTARGRYKGRDPVRIVVDSRLRTPASAQVLPARAKNTGRLIIATTARAPADRAMRLEHLGAEIWRLPEQDERVDVQALALALGEHGFTSVLVEGGARIHGAFLDADLVDELYLYVAPMVIGGGKNSLSWAGGQGVARLADAPGFRWAEPVQHLGRDMVVHAERVRGARKKRS